MNVGKFEGNCLPSSYQIVFRTKMNNFSLSSSLSLGFGKQCNSVIILSAWCWVHHIFSLSLARSFIEEYFAPEYFWLTNTQLDKIVTDKPLIDKGNVSFLSIHCIFNQFFWPQSVFRSYMMNIGKFEGNW